MSISLPQELGNCAVISSTMTPSHTTSKSGNTASEDDGVLLEFHQAMEDALHLQSSSQPTNDRKSALVVTMYERKRALRRIHRAMGAFQDNFMTKYQFDSSCITDFNNCIVEEEEDITTLRLVDILSDPLAEFFSNEEDDCLYESVVQNSSRLLLLMIQNRKRPLRNKHMDRIFDRIAILTLISSQQKQQREQSSLPSLLAVFNTNMIWPAVKFPLISMTEALHLIRILLPYITKHHFYHKSPPKENQNHNNNDNLGKTIEVDDGEEETTLQLLMFVGHALKYFSSSLAIDYVNDYTVSSDDIINNQEQEDNCKRNEWNKNCSAVRSQDNFYNVACKNERVNESQNSRQSYSNFSRFNQMPSQQPSISTIGTPNFKTEETTRRELTNSSWLFHQLKDLFMKDRRVAQNLDDGISDDELQDTIDLLQSFSMEMIQFSTQILEAELQKSIGNHKKKYTIVSLIIDLVELFRQDFCLFVPSTRVLMKWTYIIAKLMTETNYEDYFNDKGNIIENGYAKDTSHSLNNMSYKLLFRSYIEVTTQCQLTKSLIHDQIWWEKLPIALKDMWKYSTITSYLRFFEENRALRLDLSQSAKNQGITSKNESQVSSAESRTQASHSIESSVNNDFYDVLIDMLIYQMSLLYKSENDQLQLKSNQGTMEILRGNAEKFDKAKNVTQKLHISTGEWVKVQHLGLFSQLISFGDSDWMSMEDTNDGPNISNIKSEQYRQISVLSQMLQPLMNRKIVKQVDMHCQDYAVDENDVSCIGEAEKTSNLTRQTGGEKNLVNGCNKLGNAILNSQEDEFDELKRKRHESGGDVDSKMVQETIPLISDVSNPWHAFVARKVLENNYFTSFNNHHGENDDDATCSNAEGVISTESRVNTDSNFNTKNSQDKLNGMPSLLEEFISSIPLHFQTLD